MDGLDRLGVRQFFQSFLPLTSEEDLWEEMFLLTYKMKGLNYQALEGMERRERVWYIKRLAEQLEAESKAIKAKATGAKVNHGI